jgi:hypothetical protein
MAVPTTAKRATQRGNGVTGAVADAVSGVVKTAARTAGKTAGAVARATRPPRASAPSKAKSAR